MNGSTPQAYPLSWPPGKRRTKWDERKLAAFKTIDTVTRTSYDGSSYRAKDRKAMTVATSMRRLQLELDRLGAIRPIVSTNVELRLDGLPRSGSRAPDDPGVAVYFKIENDPVALACDRYLAVADDITAIAKHLEARARSSATVSVRCAIYSAGTSRCRRQWRQMIGVWCLATR